MFELWPHILLNAASWRGPWSSVKLASQAISCACIVKSTDFWISQPFSKKNFAIRRVLSQKDIFENTKICVDKPVDERLDFCSLKAPSELGSETAVLFLSLTHRPVKRQGELPRNTRRLQLLISCRNIWNFENSVSFIFAPIRCWQWPASSLRLTKSASTCHFFMSSDKTQLLFFVKDERR